jgi:hypothetical protein
MAAAAVAALMEKKTLPKQRKQTANPPAEHGTMACRAAIRASAAPMAASVWKKSSRELGRLPVRVTLAGLITTGRTIYPQASLLELFEYLTVWLLTKDRGRLLRLGVQELLQANKPLGTRRALTRIPAETGTFTFDSGTTGCAWLTHAPAATA